MPKCYICDYYDSKQMSLYRIPDRNDEYSERSGLWLKLLEEKVENVHKIRVCSKHFFQKKPANSGDYLNIDWIPNQNLGRFSKNLKLIDYHLRKKREAPPPLNLRRRLEGKEFRNPGKVDKSHTISATNSNDTAKSGDSNRNNNSLVQNDDANCDANSVASNDNDISGVNISKSANVALVNDTTVHIASTTLASGALHTKTPAEQAVGSKIKTVGPNALNTVLVPIKKRIEINKMEVFLPKSIQTDLSAEDVDRIFKYFQEAVEERNDLLTEIATLVIDIDFFKGNNKKSRFYTGLPTWSLLNNFFEMIKEFLPNHFNCKLSRFQMLVLTLMKLRLNLSFTDLGYRFRVDETTASRYFHRCIFILFKLFHNSKLVHWPDERQNLLQNVPSYFRSTFKEQITIIVDCFEIFAERPAVLRAAAQGFSCYKHHITIKYLIGISVTGVILFVSIGFGGRASDKEIVCKSGFLNKVQENDVILGDKGFLIENEIEAKKASLKRPSFVKKGCQLHPVEIEQSRDYARIRIHVERVICVLREKFNICADVAQISAIAKQNDLFDRDLYDKIIFICSSLVNICPSVVPNYFEM